MGKIGKRKKVHAEARRLRREKQNYGNK